MACQMLMIIVPRGLVARDVYRVVHVLRVGIVGAKPNATDSDANSRSDTLAPGPRDLTCSLLTQHHSARVYEYQVVDCLVQLYFAFT